MRVLIGSANERDGGAAVAASRLRDGLLAQGHVARLFVQTPGPGNPSTLAPRGGVQRTLARARSGIDALPLRRYPERHAPFSVNWLPRFLPPWPPQEPAEVVHLHWINAGFMSLGDLASLQRPTVWTLHDMWPFTGGCHYDEGCGRFRESCGSCPVLHSHKERDLSSQRFAAKRRAYASSRLTLIAPSQWMARCAAESPLTAGCRTEVIANGLDLGVFKPLDKGFARQALGLPADRPIVLFGAVNASTDPRKGHDLLQAAMARLAGLMPNERLTLAVFGSSPPRRETAFGLDTVHFGPLHDEVSLALLYAACDVFVAPSRQDNFPNTVAEALACGTPCVAFNIGGMPDMIQHRSNGYLAQAFDCEDLAAGVAWALDGKQGHQAQLRAAARQFAADRLDITEQVRRTVALYRDLQSTGAERT